MTIKSRWTVDVPRCSLAQWIFGSACDPLPDHKSFIDPDDPDNNFLTMPHFRLLAKRVALGLLRAGLQKGDRVLLFSGNSLLFPSVFLGILMAGGVVTGANPSFVPRELAYQLQDSGATFLFTAEQALDTAFEAAKEAGLSKDRVFVLGAASVPVKELATASSPGPGRAADLGGARHWTELLRLGSSPTQAEAWRWEEPADPEETTCCLNYSSGTTGVPKGVEISHYSYVANGVGVAHMRKLQPDLAHKQQTDSGLAFLPFYHAYGQTYFIANMTHLHIPVYVMPAFDFVKMLSYIQRFRITTLAVVPPIVVLLAKHPAVKQYDLSSVETIGSGAAPLAREVCEEVERQFTASTSPGRTGTQKFSIRQGWGMTELTCTALSWDPNSTVPTSSGVGELSPNCAAKLVSLETGQPITQPNTPGELWVTGPTLMRRYWRKPQATTDTMFIDTTTSPPTRWLRTGDIASIEDYRPGGIIHVVDRVKELIKVKGNQVAPAELEGVLLENSEVADAAVVGVTIGGEEVPRAYVVRRAGSKVTEGEVAKWMEGKVVRYKRLKGGVVFVEGIPKNPVSYLLIPFFFLYERDNLAD